MITDVAGRVRNIQLPTSRPLLPLFEAISNSIDAIIESGKPRGRIEIEVDRDRNSMFAQPSSSDRQLAEIIGFVVKDNGVGFSDRNFDEFNKSDTTNKASQGGKGVGRFMWLVGFDKAEVESRYDTNGSHKVRHFTFNIPSGISNHTFDNAYSGPTGTTVKLIGFKNKYRKQCPKRIETIAAFIVEEFLEFFLGPSCPKIVLHDVLDDQHIDLDRVYDEMVAHSKRDQTKVHEHLFDILHVRLYSTHITEHRMFLLGNGRVVKHERLSGIPNLIPRFKDDKNREFVYAAYVSAETLDSSVNSNRTDFDLSEDNSELIEKELTFSDIRKSIREVSKAYLYPYTEPIRLQKKERINRFVDGDGAMYRPILKHLEHKLDSIDPNASDDEIDRQFYEVYMELQTATKKQGQELFQMNNVPDLALFEERLKAYFEKVSDIHRSNLARYVCHRKAIIEFLRCQLTIQGSGKYQTEDRIHEVIFPMGKTSDDTFFEEHNLWLVDERLAFHSFLSSDKQIKQVKHLENKSEREPDIIIFDKAVAFAETPDLPFNSITVIEFKKPQRADYTDDKNPFSQVYDYVQLIIDGKGRLSDGRAFPIPPNMPFYCYIICDLNPSLDRWAKQFNFEKTPDGLGYLGYNRPLRAFLEVISYSKLISDAEKRNRAFFEKLGLPKGTIKPIPT